MLLTGIEMLAFDPKPSFSERILCKKYTFIETETNLGVFCSINYLLKGKVFRVQATKHRRGAEVQLHSFLASALDKVVNRTP